MINDHSAYNLISAFILAWSISVSWNQLIALNRGIIGRLLGIVVLIFVAAVYYVTHAFLSIF